MKGLLNLTPLLLCAVSLFLTRAEAFQLPACGTNCLTEALPQTPCSVTNTTCICTNAELTALVTRCLLANCTVLDALATKNVTSITCNAPIRSRQDSMRATAISMSVISGLFVLLRCGHRIFMLRTSLEADDWCILATAIVAVPQIYIVIHGTIANGLGLDVWTLPARTINNFGRFLYAIEMQYFLSLMLLKVSLLLFYLRIFPDKKVRLILWSTVGFVVGVSIVFILLSIFQCRPISFVWTQWDGEHSGHCINSNAMVWAHAAFSIAVDFWMLAVPLYQLRQIKLNRTKKIGVAAMFCVGTFVTVVSILRLHSLVNFAKSQNPTWDNAAVSNWSTIEVCVGIICTCMPSIRLILARISPSIFGGSSAHSYAHYQDYGANYGGAIGNAGSGRPPRSIPLVSTTHSQKDHTTLTTITINDPSEPSSLADINRSASKSSGPEDPRGIMYSKSYAVEYGSEYNDQARLVENNAMSSFHTNTPDTDKQEGRSGK